MPLLAAGGADQGEEQVAIVPVGFGPKVGRSPNDVAEGSQSFQQQPHGVGFAMRLNCPNEIA